MKNKFNLVLAKEKKMFKNNDKSFNLCRKISNIVLFVLMCLSVAVGIFLIILSATINPYRYDVQRYISSMYALKSTYLTIGLIVLILGPIFFQLIWLGLDLLFNFMLDVKLMRNVICKDQSEIQELPVLFKKSSKNEKKLDNSVKYEKLREYKMLVEEGVITEEEYIQIKQDLIPTSSKATDNVISKAKELKKLADEKVITEEEFANEKSKILKK